MFQPAEETFEGSRNMIEHGILENPKVDAALAFHVAAYTQSKLTYLEREEYFTILLHIYLYFRTIYS